MSRRTVSSLLVSITGCCLAFSAVASPQGMSKLDRGRVLDMLHTVAADVQDHYFDPNFKGVDWKAQIAEAEKRIAATDNFGMALSYIAAAVDSLNDSHTAFYPPRPAHWYDEGFEYQMIGNRCYISQVRPKSDAEKKGLKVGDELLTVNGFMPERDTLWKMRYVFNVLRPQATFQLLLQNPVDGKSRQLTVNARSKLLKRPTDMTLSYYREYDKYSDYMNSRYREMGDLMIWKLPIFFFDNTHVGAMIGKAQKHGTLILDLRGNPGGSVDSLKHLVGAFFDKDIKIGDRIKRDKTEPLIAKAQHSIFTGKLIVLVDAESASASELFARVIQIEKRGTVIGDLTAGSVMESQPHRNKMGGDSVWFYGESITDADIIMTDGNRLEHAGVTPDEKMIPTGKDMAEGKDPVLTHAAELAGVALPLEEAGKMFPYEWPPDPE